MSGIHILFYGLTLSYNFAIYILLNEPLDAQIVQILTNLKLFEGRVLDKS